MLAVVLATACRAAQSGAVRGRAGCWRPSCWPARAGAGGRRRGLHRTETAGRRRASPPAAAPPSAAAVTQPEHLGQPPGAGAAGRGPRPEHATTTAPVATEPPSTVPAGLPRSGHPHHRRPAPSARSAGPHPDAGARPRIAIVGDSLALTLGDGLQDWAKSTGQAQDRQPRLDRVRYRARRRHPLGERDRGPDPTGLRQVADRAGRGRSAQLKPHLVVVLNGLWEMVDRRLPGDDHWQHIGEPAFDQLVVQELSSFSELMASRGAAVLWLTYPQPATHVMAGLPGPFAEEDPARVARLNELIGQVVAAHPGTVPARPADLHAGSARWRAQPGPAAGRLPLDEGHGGPRGPVAGPLLVGLARLADAPAAAPASP